MIAVIVICVTFGLPFGIQCAGATWDGCPWRICVAISEVNGTPSPAQGTVEPIDQAEKAYLRIEPEILQMKEAAVGRVTVEVPFTVSLVLGALPNIETLRGAMEENLAHPPFDELSKARDYALGTLYAHLQVTPVRTQAQVAALREEAGPLRERLLISAETLGHFNLFDPSEVAQIRAGTGLLDTAEDLVALSSLYWHHWKVVQGKTPVTEAEVARAGELGPELLEALGSRTVGTVVQSGELDWAARKTRAFRLLVRCYEELRRAVTYVRWHEDDIDAYAPSLYIRRRSGASSASPEQPPPPPPSPPLPGTTPPVPEVPHP